MSSTNVQLCAKYQDSLFDVTYTTISVFSTIIRQSRKRRDKIRVFSTSMQDIKKALSKFNKRGKDIDIQAKLLLQYYKALSLFNKNLANA